MELLDITQNQNRCLLINDNNTSLIKNIKTLLSNKTTSRAIVCGVTLAGVWYPSPLIKSLVTIIMARRLYKTYVEYKNEINNILDDLF